jgi:hypothetical protein
MKTVQRKHKRQKTVQEIAIKIPEISSDEIKGILMDISEEGLGVSTEHPLQTGQLVEVFTGRAVLTGTVMWTIKQDKTFRSGVYLVNIKNLFD